MKNVFGKYVVTPVGYLLNCASVRSDPGRCWHFISGARGRKSESSVLRSNFTLHLPILTEENLELSV